MKNEEVVTETKSANYIFPSEEIEHEGTWLTWPHEHIYGKKYANEIEYIWVDMTKALSEGEKIHIVAYNEELKNKIAQLLENNKVNMNQIDFVIAKSDDVWVRDTGPMFVFDENKKLNIVDFGFDGWGKKQSYKNDDEIPKEVAKFKNIPIIDVPNFILEGGSIEIDGNKTAMLTKSAVISENRNKGMSQEEAENYLTKYMGVTNFIWLEGVINEDITDAHIDGFARFYNDETILTVSEDDFYELFENIKGSDYEILKSAKNINNKQYKLIEFPMTKNNVKGLNYKGSYLNYYIGNNVVLLPIYNDINDQKAIDLIGGLYPNKKIVSINVVPLYKNGGMIHCVTQQQPKGI